MMTIVEVWYWWRDGSSCDRMGDGSSCDRMGVMVVEVILEVAKVVC